MARCGYRLMRPSGSPSTTPCEHWGNSPSTPLRKRFYTDHYGGVTTPTASSLVDAANLRLSLLDLPRIAAAPADHDALVAPLLERQRELSHLLADQLPPVDARIEGFLSAYLSDLQVPRLPRQTLTLDLPGLARVLSLPIDSDRYTSELITSYRTANGVLHNPRNDRRTTAGVFHIAEGGLPIPDDKKAVPREVFAQLLRRALNPPSSLMELPVTSTQVEPARCFVSLLLRPLVVVGEWDETLA